MVKRKIRVMIVDDQALVLDILSKGITRDPGIEVVGTATDGRLALNQINRLKPDVIVLDMEMPIMNGIEFLSKLMPVSPIPTVVLSALTHKDSKITLQAFELGAVDFLSKPSGGAKALPILMTQLRTKIKIAATQDVSQFKFKSRSASLPSTALDRQARTNQIVLGMGAFDASREPGKILKIYALGSCVGVCLFCPPSPAVAMAHVVLPDSKTDPDKARKMPGYFANTAIEALLAKMKILGCMNGNIKAKIAGGAKTSVDIGDYFGVGQRNAVAVKAALLKKNIKVVSDELGGVISRTVYAKAGDMNLYLQHPEKGSWQI